MQMLLARLNYRCVGLLTCGPNGRLARMLVTHQLHLQLRPVNAALTFWRDGDRFSGKHTLAMEGVSVGQGGQTQAWW